MNRSILIIAAAMALPLVGAGCFTPRSSVQPATNATLSFGNNLQRIETKLSDFMASSQAAASKAVNGSSSTLITYLASAEETTKFCDGENMDSDGYRQTITVEKTAPAAAGELSPTDLAQATLSAATEGTMCQQVVQQATVSNGALYIPPIDGWAGVSITMCWCRPLVEVNALRLPEVTQVIWQ